MQDNSFLVFVYGTLRKGQGNNTLLQDGKFLGVYETKPDFTMVDLGCFPAVSPQGKTSISGELYLIDQPAFTNLDQLEGYPTYYDRIQIDTPKGKAWLYVIHHLVETHKVVESGDWIKHTVL